MWIRDSKVTKKYDGLDGTELAISESQERMAVALALSLIHISSPRSR